MTSESTVYVGVTDGSWYKFLAEKQPDEVNFWQPGGKQAFRALKPCELFLFKLHSPLNYIAGGGFFVRHADRPVSLAWVLLGGKMGRWIVLHFCRQSINIEKITPEQNQIQR